MTSLVEQRHVLLAAWSEGLLSDVQIHRWADRQFLAVPAVRDVPAWLLDLVQYGPGACRDRQGFDWPRGLDYRTGFALRAAHLRLEVDAEVEAFALWAAGNAIGEDLAQPEVRFGYGLDHCLGDCRRPDWAIEEVRRDLPGMLDRCRARAAQVLGLVD